MKIPDFSSPLENLLQIARDLRSPEGCPWDKEQTHRTVLPHLVEETYEAIDAFRSGDRIHFQEELGDLLFQIVFHAQLSQEEGGFNFTDIAKTISEKLIRRHPHVYSETTVTGTEGVLAQWDEIKKKEKPSVQNKQTLEDVPASFPPILKAQKIQSKVRKLGFDWQDPKGIEKKVEEEWKELLEAKDLDSRKEELGDLLFTLINLSYHYGIDPEESLALANQKFTSRFHKMERMAGESQKKRNLEEWDRLWEEAKRENKYG